MDWKQYNDMGIISKVSSNILAGLSSSSAKLTKIYMLKVKFNPWFNFEYLLFFSILTKETQIWTKDKLNYNMYIYFILISIL